MTRVFLQIFVTLITASSFTVAQRPALAHEKTFPTKQLNALASEPGLSFKEASAKPTQDALKEYEQKFGLKFSKGELAGPLYLAMDKEKKVKSVALFLDGKSDAGDTEFGASVTPDGKIEKVVVFSSPESADATSGEFLKTLNKKNADELDAYKRQFGEKETSKKYIVELAQKATLRVQASFKKKEARSAP